MDSRCLEELGVGNRRLGSLACLEGGVLMLAEPMSGKLDDLMGVLEGDSSASPVNLYACLWLSPSPLIKLDEGFRPSMRSLRRGDLRSGSGNSTADGSDMTLMRLRRPGQKRGEGGAAISRDSSSGSVA
jgi:hypothetical protein